MTRFLSGAGVRRLVVDRRFWLLPLAVWTAVVAASLTTNWLHLETQAEQMALNRARFVFKMVESVRLWNARHGGVYAPVHGETVPNPHLEVPERDLTTPSGRELTMINPAYMTRQLAGVVQELADVRLHITSLKPLNPNNAADPWESSALKAFENGLRERTEFFGRGKNSVYRYMAPLVTVKACLTCHEQQGYVIGDIRGGVSVAFAADPLLAPIAKGQRQQALVHGGVWLLLTALSLFALSRFRYQMLQLEAAKEQQERIVDVRTAELRAEVRDRQKAEAQLRLLIESSGEAIIGVDTSGTCMLCNPEALRVLGYEENSEVVGRNVHRLVEHSHKDGTPRNPAESAIRSAYVFGNPAHLDGDVFWRADGTPFPVEYRAHPLRAGDEVIGAVITFADITERKTAQDRIWRQANYDGLTGLVNRRLFADRLEQHVSEARRTGGRFGLLYIDLDDFKEVNDTMGHDAGDELLREAARRIAGAVRSSDTVARLGGDEFTVVVQLQERQDLKRIVEKITAGFAEPLQLHGMELRLRGSVGTALFPDDGNDTESLLRAADQAMYACKRQRAEARRSSPENPGPDMKA